MDHVITLPAGFTGVRLVDLVVAFMLLEFVVLVWRRRWRATAAMAVGLALAPGLCLILAMRLALTGASWIWVGLLLGAALPFHLADLWRRGL